jgi:putative ABC transport system permease protein
MNKQIIIASLKARPVRTTVSILAVALEVTLILLVVGLISGASTETGRRIEGVGADIIIQPPNASLIFALNSASIQRAYSAKFAEVEGVKAVAPVLTMTNAKSTGLEVIYGIEPASFDAVTGGFKYIKGRLFQEHTNPVEVIVDDRYASAKKKTVGDEVQLVGHTFKIAGIVEQGKGSRIFMPLKAAQEMQGLADYVSMFYVTLNNPRNLTGSDWDAAVSDAIDRIHAKPGFADFKLTALREFASLMMTDTQGLIDNVYDAVIFVAACVGVLVIFLSMYTTITERTREIGILRSLGASKRMIVTLIMQESLVIALMGVVLGLGFSLLLGRIIQGMFPTLIVLIPTDWMLRATIFALISGLIGAIYPSIKAAKHDPVEALAYE